MVAEGQGPARGVSEPPVRMSRSVIAALVVVSLVCLAASASLAWHLAGDDFTSAIDLSVWRAMPSLRGPLGTFASMLATDVGSGVGMTLLTALGAIVLWARRRRLQAVVFVTSMASGALAVAVLKNVADRPRPPAADAVLTLPESFSFPSGHAFSSMLSFVLLAAVLSADLRTPAGRAAGVSACIVAALAVGLSRVYLGVHWLSDVVASWSLAWAWASATGAVYLSLREGAASTAARG